MKLKNVLILVAAFLFQMNIMAQDMDEIFDDGDNTNGFDLVIESDIITLIAGTPNVYGEVQLMDRFGFQAGIGLLPFTYLMDISSSITLSDDGEILTNSIRKGLFYDINFKYLTSFGDSFSYYYYLGMKKWRYTEGLGTNVGLKNHRRKINFGLGYNWSISSNVGLNLHTGIFTGKIWDVNEGPYHFGNRFVGFDLGVGAYYSL